MTLEFLWSVCNIPSWSLLLVLIIALILFMSLSGIHFRKSNKSFKKISGFNPFVSVIIPCCNEEITLENCIKSLLEQSYKNMEIIVVDDGSTDSTKDVARKIASNYPEKVKFFSKSNGGKASALNYGIIRASGEIIVGMDADSVFLSNTVTELIAPFYNSNISAVGGNVKVANREKIFNKMQAVEYIRGLNIHRRTFAYLGCMQVISGAIGAFRKDILLEIGGYSSDTLVEDMDVVVTLVKAGHKVDYNGNAIAYTESPETLTDFFKQRYRWAFGSFQVLRKHRDMLFNSRYGTMGMIGLPIFLIFPWLNVILSLLFGIALIRLIILGGLTEFLLFFAFVSLIDGFASLYALNMDNEKKWFALLSIIGVIWYYHFINLAIIKAGIDYLGGSKASWNKLVRLGHNHYPVKSMGRKS